MLTIILLIALIVSFWLYTHAERAVQDAYERRHRSLGLAEELHRSSNELTRMAQTFVVTGDPRAQRRYRELLEIRDGQRPRPAPDYAHDWTFMHGEGADEGRAVSGQGRALLDRLHEIGLSERENALLAEAKSRSDELTALEYKAMRLAEQAKQAGQAQQMLFDATYHQIKADIMRPIDAFIQRLDQRTGAAVQAAQRWAMILRVVFIVFGLSLSLTLWRTRAALREVLGASALEVRDQIARLGQGDFATEIRVPSGRANSVMGWLAETRQRLSALEHRRREAEQQVQLSEARYRLLADNALDVIWTMSLDGAITSVSPAIETLRGITPQEALQQSLEEILTPASQAVCLDYFATLQAAIAAGHFPPSFRGELEYWCRDGSTIWANVIALPLPGPDGAPTELLGMSRDINALKKAETEATERERHLRRLLQHLPVAISVVAMRPGQPILFSNTQFEQTFGYLPHEIPMMADWARLAYPDAEERRAAFAFWDAAVAQASERQDDGLLAPCEFQVTRRDGEVRDVVISATLLDDLLICAFIDRTDRKRTEIELMQARDAAEQANRALQAANQELHRLATTDQLTEIWNRRHFEESVGIETARARRYSEALSLILFDIDHFKLINDTHGHQAGDKVLVTLAARVRAHLRQGDLMARWGGEEFVVLLPRCPAPDARQLAEALRRVIEAEPFPVVGRVTSSFGVSAYRLGEGHDAWFKRVDDALYAAKTEGRNRVCSR